MNADPDNDKTFGVIIRAKCAIVGHVFGAKLRVNEESFRQQRFDRLPELLRIIVEEEKRLPARLLVEAATLRPRTAR